MEALVACGGTIAKPIGIMKALIIGATGVTGRDLLDVLLGDPAYTEVVTFVRRPTGKAHSKLVEVVTDFGRLEAVAGAIKGDVWFSCLGTTLKAAGSKEKQWQIDYEIPAKFAVIAKANGVARAVVVSAYGASASSRVFYSRLKGKLDDHIASLGFERTILFRPGLLLRKDTDRLGERLSAAGLKFLNALGILRRFHPLPTALFAQRLAEAPKRPGSGTQIIELDEIFD